MWPSRHKTHAYRAQRAIADDVAKIVNAESLAVINISALAQEAEILRRRILVLP